MNPIIYSTAENRILNYIQEWGVLETEIKINQKNSPYFKETKYSIRHRNRRFAIVLNAQLDAQSGFQFQWFVRLHFNHKKVDGLDILIRRETVSDKLFKLVGFKESEILADAFDRAFWIESKHNYAHAALLCPEVQANMLPLRYFFDNLYILKDTTRIKMNYNKHNRYKFHFKKEFLLLLQVGFDIASNVDKSELI
jgi:hypothetical protein